MWGPGGAGPGIDDTFGCDSISDEIDPSGGCAQAQDWFSNPNWSPWNIEFTGTLYGKYYDETFETWAQYADWSTGIAALPASQCYQEAMTIASNQGLSSVSGTCTSSAFGLVYSFLWSDNGDSADESVNAAAVNGWSDPITSFHGGAHSWYLGGFLDGFFDTTHLVDSIDGGLGINAHSDPFGPFNPLHYIVQIPLTALNPSGQSWSGTCSAVGGCSFP